MPGVQWIEGSLDLMQDPPTRGGGLRYRGVRTSQYLIYLSGPWDLPCSLSISQASDLQGLGNETDLEVFPPHNLDLED